MAKADKHAPWLPPARELADISAIQALARGEADLHQQQRAFKWIIEVAAGTYQPSYRSDSERDTCFAEGRRFVGLELVTMLKLNVSSLRRNDVPKP